MIDTSTDGYTWNTLSTLQFNILEEGITTLLQSECGPCPDGGLGFFSEDDTILNYD